MGRHAKVMGVELDDQPLVSLDGLRRHKSSVVDGMVAAHKKMFADSGMDFILGPARFIAPRTVEVETRDEPIRLLRGTDVVINTWDDAGHPRSGWHLRVEGLDVGGELAVGTVAAATDRFGRWIRRLRIPLTVFERPVMSLALRSSPTLRGTTSAS